MKQYRSKYEYLTLRYILDHGSDEFFNIGVIVWNDASANIKFIENTHFNMLCSIDKKTLNGLIDNAKRHFKISSGKDINTAFSRWYGDNITKGKNSIFRHNGNLESAIDRIYEQMIGYKFKAKEYHHTSLEIAKENIGKVLSKSSFSKYIKTEFETHKDIKLIINDKEARFAHIGSSSNSYEVSTFAMHAFNRYYSNGYKNDFLDIKRDGESAEMVEKFLESSKATIYPFQTEELVEAYCENVIKESKWAL